MTDLVGVCQRCNSLHPVNGPCPTLPPGESSQAATVTTFAHSPRQADQLWAELIAVRQALDGERSVTRQATAARDEFRRQRDEARNTARRLEEECDRVNRERDRLQKELEWITDERDRLLETVERRSGALAANALLAGHAAPAALVETYECGCQGTPGNRCPMHSCP